MYKAQTYKVTLSPSGREFSCLPGETILESALRSGISLEYGCRNAACGACKGRLLSGRVSYKDPEAVRREKLADGEIFYCAAIPESDLRIESTETGMLANEALKTPCKVIQKRILAHDVVQLRLKLPEAIRVPFHAGQYLDIHLDDEQVRSFSIANAPHQDDDIELHIRHVEGGSYTDYLFNKLNEKDILRIELPLGTFFLHEDADRPIIMMGGGTGFAPLKAILEHAFYIGFDRPIHLFWGVRARRDLYMPELPLNWAKRHKHFRYTPVLSDPAEGDRWQGRTGFVHQAVLQDYPDLKDFDVYMSGPPVMIDAGKSAFHRAGLPEDRIFSDAFEYNAHPEVS